MKGDYVYVIDGWNDDEGAIVEVYEDKVKARERAGKLQEEYPGLFLGVVRRKVK